MELFSTYKEVNCDLYLYHYTKFDTAINHIIRNGKLLLNTFNKVNDPRESKEWGITYRHCKIPPDIKSNDIKEINNKLRLKWKVLCMVADTNPEDNFSDTEKVYCRGYSHSRMWNQYSDNHRGACLGFADK